MSQDLSGERREYRGEHLTDDVLPSDPYELFGNWFGEAMQAQKQGLLREPNAMAVSTVREESDGTWRPRSRVVLLKEWSGAGLTFFTNYESDKGRELANNPWASAVFWWPVQAHQVRFEGTVAKVPRAESEAYFRVRPRGSQIGAWASDQSRPVESIDDMHERYQQLEREFEGREVPCPDFWGGYLLSPTAIEFWQGQPSRLHDRVRYTHPEHGWRVQRLNP